MLGLRLGVWPGAAQKSKHPIPFRQNTNFSWTTHRVMPPKNDPAEKAQLQTTKPTLPAGGKEVIADPNWRPCAEDLGMINRYIQKPTTVIS